MPNAARVNDPTSHPGKVSGPGVRTVLVERRPAAVVLDIHACALPPKAGPHPPNPFLRGSTSVRIGGRGALRVGDAAACGAIITAGASSVRIGD